MKYNFYRYGDNYPFFDTREPGNAIVKGNSIILDNKMYDIKHVETIFERSDVAYSSIKAKEVHVYIKERVNCSLL